MATPTLKQITMYLNKELKINSFKESSKNGLLVKASGNITKIGFCVDPCMESFQKAKKFGCELLITHHSIIRKGVRDELREKRISFLKNNMISLYSLHQPLDINPKYGNNIIIARHLGLYLIKMFGKEKSGYWGYQGRLRKPLSTNTILAKINAILPLYIVRKPIILNFGRNKNKNIAIITGSGSFALTEAKRNNIDLLITGEIKHSTYHEAKELGINIIAAGHYNTETLGVKTLQKLLSDKFKVKTVFIDCPTGL